MVSGWDFPLNQSNESWDSVIRHDSTKVNVGDMLQQWMGKNGG